MSLPQTKIERLYNMADDEMRALARLFLGHGRSHQPALAAKDPEVTSTWLNELETAIGQADQAETIDGRRAKGKDATTGKTLSLTLARAALQELFFYVRKAYPDSEAQQELFGTDLYDEARQHVGHMETLLVQAARRAAEPAQLALLKGKGYSDAEFGKLRLLAGLDEGNSLVDAHAAAGMQRTTNQVTTEHYIRLHNKV
jgi:hypothetical protein